ARAVDFWKMGHIPGAVCLPEEDFDRAYAALEPRLRGTYNIVVYCSGFGCDASHVVARQLRDKGIHAAILNEGWPAWTDAGYPTPPHAPPNAPPPRGLPPPPAQAGNAPRPPLLQAALRLFLGGFFLYASLDKIANPAAFAKIVYQWQVLSPVPANFLAVTLP